MVRFTGVNFSVYYLDGLTTALERDLADGCEIFAFVEQPRLSIDSNGRVRGSFVVGSTGTCFQQPEKGARKVAPGTYNLVVGCLACQVATFRVTGPG